MSDPAYLAAIDGVAKEDLVYGIDNDNKKNSENEVKESIALLDAAMAMGRAVFTVEYVKSEKKRLVAQKLHDDHGYRLLFAERDLKRPPALTPPLPPDPAIVEATPLPDAGPAKPPAGTTTPGSMIDPPGGASP